MPAAAATSAAVSPRHAVRDETALLFPHSAAFESLLAALGASAAGLSNREAAARLARSGFNELPEARRPGMLRRFLKQFASPLVYLLVLASVLAVALGHFTDAIVIAGVVFLNATIGLLQERRAERSLDALKKLNETFVRVWRDAAERRLPARELVEGDIVELAAGDLVPADGRILEARSFAVAEAALTGESVPGFKAAGVLPRTTPVSDRTNMVFSGTHVTAGRARVVVVLTGMRTEVGRIARLTSAGSAAKTPLEQRIAVLGRQLVFAALALCVVVMAVGWWRDLPLQELVMVTVSQMVSVVPEGLPAAMTIALVVGVRRMARSSAIVRELSAVETLGSTTVICTDKTGTLTRNEMTVTRGWLADGRWFETAGAGYSPEGTVSIDATDPLMRRLLEAGALCNDARLVAPDASDPRWRSIGDPTEVALVVLAAKGGIDVLHVARACPRRAELPFDADAKLMLTLQVESDGSLRTLVKGAPEALLPLCGGSAADGVPFDRTARLHALGHAQQLAAAGLRVLALAEATGVAEVGSFRELNGKLSLLGIVGMTDPPRAEVSAALERCETAGIRTIMITGDHRHTGMAVARQLGIAGPDDVAVAGVELDAMSEADLRAQLARIKVYARVHPAQKLRIVEALQSEGEVVAVTGDGVNDAPALSRADVGVAMGLSGTEVAKSAAKIVIADDNFATIVRAIEEGRLVYANIQKLVLFLLTTSIDEVAILLGALFLGYPVPLAAVQILWINLVTEGALTVNFVMEGPEGHEMRRPPLPRDARLFTRPMLLRAARMVSASVAVTLGYYAWRLSLGTPVDAARTEAFTLLVICQWFNALNCESGYRSVFSFRIWRNGWLLAGLIAAGLLQLFVVYSPWGNRFFHTVPIPTLNLLLIAALGSAVMWTDEMGKLWERLARNGTECQGVRCRWGTRAAKMPP